MVVRNSLLLTFPTFTNPTTVQGALDYLERNADKSVEDLKAEETASQVVPTPGEEARSLTCNDCKKQFRTHAQAEFHATKTGHDDFSESTEEVAPLTEEQRKEKLEEARLRLAAKRAEMSEVEKEERKRNDQIKRKATKEQADIKEDLEKKEQLKDAMKKKQEKRDEIEAKRRVQDKIKADKEERKRKADLEKAQREGQTLPAETIAKNLPAGVPVPKPITAHTEARLRLQTSGGNVQKNFSAETTLFEVAHALTAQDGVEVNSFQSTFPKKTWERSDFGMSLKEAGWVPSKVLIVS